MQFLSQFVVCFSVLYKQTDPTKDPTDVVFDVNKLSKDGSIALDLYCSSRDDSLFAYGLTTNGFEWNTIKILNFTTLKNCDPDELKYVRGSSISWARNNEGFFYSV